MVITRARSLPCSLTVPAFARGYRTKRCRSLQRNYLRNYQGYNIPGEAPDALLSVSQDLFPKHLSTYRHPLSGGTQWVITLNSHPPIVGGISHRLITCRVFRGAKRVWMIRSQCRNNNGGGEIDTEPTVQPSMTILLYRNRPQSYIRITRRGCGRSKRLHLPETPIYGPGGAACKWWTLCIR